MKVWVFVQHSHGGMRADVFRTEARAWETVDTFIKVNWPKEIPMPANKGTARRQFAQVRSDITVMLREVEVRD